VRCVLCYIYTFSFHDFSSEDPFEYHLSKVWVKTRQELKAQTQQIFPNFSVGLYPVTILTLLHMKSCLSPCTYLDPRQKTKANLFINTLKLAPPRTYFSQGRRHWFQLSSAPVTSPLRGLSTAHSSTHPQSQWHQYSTHYTPESTGDQTAHQANIVLPYPPFISLHCIQRKHCLRRHDGTDHVMETNARTSQHSMASGRRSSFLYATDMWYWLMARYFRLQPLP
jgi:hypothetical protein